MLPRQTHSLRVCAAYRQRFGASLVLSCGLALCSSAQAADPTTADCLAASDASLRAGNEHKLRSERAQLLICAAPSCPADIRKECLRRVDEVNAAIPTIVFEVKDGHGNDLSAVRVTMDGEVLSERLEGTALSIDPGEHTFVFETPGQPPVKKQLVVREAEKERREAVRFGAAPVSAPASAAPPASALEPAPASSAPNAAGPVEWSPQKIGAVVAAGVGVVGIGIGSAFGVSALSKRNHAREICPDACADSAGVNAWSRAKSAGNLSTVFFVMGGVGVAAAAALWFTAPTAAGSTQVGVGPNGFQMRGVW